MQATEYIMVVKSNSGIKTLIEPVRIIDSKSDPPKE